MSITTASSHVWFVVQPISCVGLFATPWTARLPCLPLSPWVCSNLSPLSQWCHPTTSSSVSPFSSCDQSFPASGSFPISWLFSSGSQSIRALASVIPVNIQGWFPLGLTGLISLLSRDFQESSPAKQLKSISSLVLILLSGTTLTSIHDYWKKP